MENQQTSYKVLKNVSYTTIGYVWTIVFSIVITPVIVKLLGVERYGTYIFINTTLSLIGLLDLGYSTAVSKYLSEELYKDNVGQIKTIVHNANAIFFLIGLAGFFFFVLFGLFCGNYFHLNLSLFDRLIIFTLAGLIFFVSSCFSVFGIIQTAFLRFDLGAKVSLVILTASNLLILVFVYLGFGLKTMYVIQLFFAIIAMGVSRHNANKIVPHVSWRLKWDRQEIVKNYRFGLVVFLSNLGSQSLLQLDRFIISAVIGPAALSYYSLPGNVAQKTAGIVNSLASVILPMSSGYSGSGQFDKLAALYIRSFRMISIVSAGMSTTIAFFAYEILYYWLGEEFAIRGASVLVVLAITNFFVSLFLPLSSFLLGIGRTRLLAVYSIGMALLNIVFLFVLLPFWGINGAAWAYLFSVLPVFGLLYFFEVKLLKLRGFLLKNVWLYTKLVITAAFNYFFVKLLLLKLVINIFTLLVVVGVGFLSFLLIYWLLGFAEDEDKVVLHNFFQTIRRKFNNGF